MSLLAVIIPMYNEEFGAETCITKVCEVLQNHLPESRLFVVNDGSQDNTLEILYKIKSEHTDWQLEIVHSEKNRGYGGACLLGAQQALAKEFEYGLFMDSDLTNDPEMIPRFAEKLMDRRLDLLKASRYIPKGKMEGVPLHRQMISRYGNRVAEKLFGLGIRDCTNGFRAVRLSLIATEHFEERGFPSIMEELYILKIKGARMGEIPYILTSRNDPRGTSFQYKPEIFRDYLKYAVKAFFVPYRPRQGDIHE